MMADFGEASCSLVLPIMVTQSGGRKLTCIVVVAVHNLHV
jgi:hypothetical protein